MEPNYHIFAHYPIAPNGANYKNETETNYIFAEKRNTLAPKRYPIGKIQKK